MLEDPDTSDLIAWSSHGDLFSVSNPTAFSKSVLPQYFKHNNWQSFVRQLNMYGFHKVNDLIHSNLTNENQTWEFKHPNFRRGAVGDLQHIKRKSAKTQ
ncbi:heat shock factor-type transcription factor, partial [Mucor lusitanicus CBS 277.49]